MAELINPKTFELKSNYCLIKLSPSYDLLVLDGPQGKKIEIKIISHAEQAVNHFSISGTVIKKPLTTFYFQKKDRDGKCREEFGSLMKESLQYDVDFNFSEGDKVYFNYNAQLDADKEGRIVDTKEHGLCILIHYNSLYGYLKDNEIVPVNGYIFFKRDVADREVTFESGIIGIQEVKQYDSNYGTVVIADAPVRGYLDGGRDGDAVFEPGTRIMVQKNFGHRMAYDLHGGDLKDVEVAHRKNIVCILEGELA